MESGKRNGGSENASQPNQGTRRAVHYALLTVALIVVFAMLRGSDWRSSAFFHTVIETVATLLALIVGTLGLVRFYSKRENKFLFIGSGFIGTALLDGYHAIVTAEPIAPFLPSDLRDLIPWSWVASRLFLSVIMFVSWLAWMREQRQGSKYVMSDLKVYACIGAWMAFCFIFFTQVPLPPAHYPDLHFHRPEEFVPAAFFGLALVGYLRKGEWRTDVFEHALVLSLIVGFLSQVMFMSLSGRVFDGYFDVAHMLKKVSYILVLVGLLFNVLTSFQRADETIRFMGLAREAEQHSRELTERLRLATENARIGIWDWDLAKDDLVWDEGMYSIYGIKPRDFASAYEAWQAGLHPDDKAAASAAVDAALKDEQPFEIIFRVVLPDGEIRHIQAFGLVQRDAHGKAVRMLGTNWDITAQKRAEEMQRNINTELESRVEERTAELQRLNRELKQHSHALENSNRDLESFAYVASHDLQEPLRKIQAFGDILRDDLLEKATEDDMDSLDTITSSAARMSMLIEALLVFSRVGNQGSKRDWVDLNRVLREVLNDLEIAIKRTAAEITVEPLDSVRGDYHQLRRLFQNLVGNSLKYFRKGAALKISIRSEIIATGDQQGDIVVRVRDTGRGFSQEYAEQIFKPFRRLERRGSDTPGTGIGLAICRRIVERHHGTITAKGEAGVGAEFIVTFPSSIGDTSPGSEE